VAMGFSESANHEGMNHNGNGSDKDTLYMLSGAALMLFGAGLILSNPVVRKYLGQAGVGNLLTAALPDVDRYLKLRNM